MRQGFASGGKAPNSLRRFSNVVITKVTVPAAKKIAAIPTFEDLNRRPNIEISVIPTVCIAIRETPTAASTIPKMNIPVPQPSISGRLL